MAKMKVRTVSDDGTRRFEFAREGERSRIIRSFLRFLDEGSTPGHPGHAEETLLEANEDNDGSTDTGVGSTDHSGDPDGGGDLGSTEDKGQSNPPTQRVGGEVDEGATGGPDRSPEPASEPGERQASDQRTDETSERDSLELSESASVFGAFQHC